MNLSTHVPTTSHKTFISKSIFMRFNSARSVGIKLPITYKKALQ